MDLDDESNSNKTIVPAMDDGNFDFDVQDAYDEHGTPDNKSENDSFIGDTDTPPLSFQHNISTESSTANQNDTNVSDTKVTSVQRSQRSTTVQEPKRLIEMDAGIEENTSSSMQFFQKRILHFLLNQLSANKGINSTDRLLLLHSLRS